MRQRISLKCVMFVLLVFLCVTVGCKNNNTTIVTTFPENGPTVKAAAKKAEQMLTAGTDIDVILTTLEDQLKADPRVLDVSVGSEDGTVSFIFVDGETHTIALTDEDNDAEFSSPISAGSTDDSHSIAMKTGSYGTKSFQLQAGDQGYYRMPANNHALLANGYVRFHGLNGENDNEEVTLVDSTDKIKEMLEARGYKVDRYEGVREDGATIPILPVAVFQTLTDYGVILIETHGGRREFQKGREALPPILQDLPNCGGENSHYQFLTTDFYGPPDPQKATRAEVDEYNENIQCGRLGSYAWWIRNKQGRKVRKVGQLFTVTPNYIRQYNPGMFPDNTLMMLNVCSGGKVATGNSSPMQALLFEKSNKGARFLGWDGETRVAAMGRASLNLFQLMTASNEELEVNGFEYLEKSTPPQGGRFTPLTPAFEQLRIHDPSYLTDPPYKKKKETHLQLTSQDGEDSDLILMPHPLDINGSGSDRFWYMGLYCDSQPTATVGETEVSLENVGVNTWKFSMPVGAYGDIVVTENERVSIPRTLHRWRPQIKMDSTYTTWPFPFLHINATFTLLARATIDTLSFRDSAWNDPPPVQFQAQWDYDGSNVAWKIDGQGTDENGMFWQYNGSGLESLKALAAKSSFGAGTFYTNNGSTLLLQVCADPLSYTYQFKASDGSGGQDQDGYYLCGTVLDNNLIPLGADWSVSAGSYQDNMMPAGPVLMSWNAFAAEPPFDKDNEPR